MKFRNKIMLLYFFCFSSISMANQDSSSIDKPRNDIGFYFTPSVFNQNIQFRLSWTTGLLYEYSFTERFFVRTGISHSVYKIIDKGVGTTDEILIDDIRWLLFESPLLIGFNIAKIKEKGHFYISAGLINLLLYNSRQFTTHTVTGGKSEWIRNDLEYGLFFQTSVGAAFSINRKINVFAEPVLTYWKTTPIISGLQIGIKNNF